MNGSRSGFSVAQSNYAFWQVDIIPAQGKCFAKPHACSCQNANKKNDTIRLFLFSFGIRQDLAKLRRVLVPTMSGAQIPLVELADIEFVSGPAMLRDENGMLSGYVFVDLAERDVGSYVAAAKLAVRKDVALPAGYTLAWSGQYEAMERVRERLKVVLPLTLWWACYEQQGNIIALFADAVASPPIVMRLEALGHACILAGGSIPGEADCVIVVGDAGSNAALLEAAEEAGLPVLRLAPESAAITNTVAIKSCVLSRSGARRLVARSIISSIRGCSPLKRICIRSHAS